ncbi:MAG TPA: hypothetical protein VEA78_07965 [Acidimicrobiales bacterium]|nr:hypothetical protein [Acidimicrobiales bacterium]
MADIAAITIRRPRHEVEQRWGIEGPGEPAAFADAPGDQGTEVRSECSMADLRRFKQVLETGSIVVSDARPEGARDLSESMGQRPGQPMEEVA